MAVNKQTAYGSISEISNDVVTEEQKIYSDFARLIKPQLKGVNINDFVESIRRKYGVRISRPYLRMMESGQSRFPIRTMLAISNELGLTFDIKIRPFRKK